MEVAEENIPSLVVPDVAKSNSLNNEDETGAVAADLCHKSNGIAEIKSEAGQAELNAEEDKTDDLADDGTAKISMLATENTAESMPKSEMNLSSEFDECSNDKNTINDSAEGLAKDKGVSTLDESEVLTEVTIDHETDISNEDDIVNLGVLEASSDDAPKFRTEILIEANDNLADPSENMSIVATEQTTSNSLLKEIGESIELSDVLRSDISESPENNNSSARQEVFNKEELLDILEGNDVEPISEQSTDDKPVSLPAFVETKLALQQLSRLKNEKRRSRARIAKVKKDMKDLLPKEKSDSNDTEKQVEKNNLNKIQPVKSVDYKVNSITDKIIIEKKKSNKNADSEENSNTKAEIITKRKKSSKDSAPAGNIVNVLVMDWDDEDQDPNESDSKKATVVKEYILNDSEKPTKTQEEENEEKPSARTSTDSIPSEEQAQKGKSGDENQPQRRLGRVIKKKVIFDPDNPDTFTKTKAKNRASVKDHAEKDQVLTKKVKHELTPQRSKSKSPMSNLQWKKPSSKNSKQNKRLTEVDKLLMDEGAVNMIYQLTPEAPKGKKSRETKAEFIKKIQSSTPDSKEMKFRERKKEILKYEDAEGKKNVGAKHRVSLNSSIKSPSVSEDFETHSADDSIIYRRHSSSSYSSSCMSPRRLSDVDTCSAQTISRTTQSSSDNISQGIPNVANADQATDVFMSDNANKSPAEVINKDDYLSIKEKLNSKLSLALNKRKRESSKNEKPPKQKKVARVDDNSESFTKSLGEFKYVTIKINQRLAEVCIEKIGQKYNIEVLKEIEQALVFVNSIKDTSVTLLTSECGTLCSSLDLKHVIEEDKMQRINNALEVAETIRSLLLTVDKHGKLLCAGVRERCCGVGLALAALADMLLASERAMFALAPDPRAPSPGVAALAARCRLPQSTLNDMILFGRQLSASEALQGGLVSKLLLPNHFDEQVNNIAKDIAAEPASIVMLKKQLINLKKTEETEQTFLSCLDSERDIFVDYWTSVEGQEILRTTDTA